MVLRVVSQFSHSHVLFDIMWILSTKRCC